jgi:hypothetical protein
MACKTLWKFSSVGMKVDWDGSGFSMFGSALMGSDMLAE